MKQAPARWQIAAAFSAQGLIIRTILRASSSFFLAIIPADRQDYADVFDKNQQWEAGRALIRVLFLGDIVGHSGRMMLRNQLAAIRREREIDCVIANGENAAGGAGLTAEIANSLREWGVDGITLGDHVWDQRQFDVQIDDLKHVCRPANLPPGCPGKEYLIVNAGSLRLGVVTFLGRTLMKIHADCPFRTADTILAEIIPQCDSVLVEIHAETTAEKIAFGWYMDGRATAVVGTHTHVATADERFLPRGTAYITDVGMTGPHHSVIGRDVEPVIARFVDGMPRKFNVATEDVQINGVLMEINPKTRAAEKFERIQVRQDPQ